MLRPGTRVRKITKKVGQPAPDFELEDTDGQVVSLESLVTSRPVILAFYRGRW